MRYSYEQRQRLDDTIAENKEKLNQAFKFLRKNYLIARQNFRCCSSCASSEIETDIEKMLDAGKVVAGWVFYHRQDFDGAFGEDGNGELYLAYGGASTEKYEKNGLRTVEVGRFVTKVLEASGLVHEWDGSEDTRILVKLSEKPVEKIKVDIECWGE